MNVIMSLFSNTLVAFLILVSIVVVAHELGHFLIGRWLGIGVEEFSIGFGPKIFSFRIGQTQYRINWFLLGGYVRFYGADTEKQVSPEDRERSILHAKLYKRMLVSFGGPFANFVLSLCIMVFLFSFGLTKQPPVFRVLNHSVAYETGLRSGDRVVSIDGKDVSDWSALIHKISSSPNKPLHIEIERDGATQNIVVTPKSEAATGFDGTQQTVGRIGISPFFSPPSITPWQNQFFSQIGILTGDKIISLDGMKINYLDQFMTQFENLTKSNSDVSLARLILKGQLKPLSIVIQRNEITQTIQVNFKSSQLLAWSKTVLANPNRPEHTIWSNSVGSPELTMSSFEEPKPNDKTYYAKLSLSECGLKPNDTIRKIGDSPLLSSQLDLYSWLDTETNRINESIHQFKNNSIESKIMVTDSNGKTKMYSCFLPIRQGHNELNKEKLFLDFPIKFVSDPIVAPAVKIKGKNIFDNIKLGFNSVLTQTTFIFTGFKKLFSGNIPLSTLGGPLAIAGFAGDAAKAGFETFLLAMSLMSINIGIFNLLPLPALDGGTLLLQFVELFYRKPLSKKTQELIARIGIAFLLTLFAFVFYNDIARLFYSR